MSVRDLRRIEVEEVRRVAANRWHDILRDLAPRLEVALEKAGKHVPCPVHGGKDGFRLFRDYRVTGGGICNTCGSYPDGFGLLMWVNGWRFTEALAAVAEWLNVGHSPVGPAPRARSVHATRAAPEPVASQPADSLVYRDAEADARLCAVIDRTWSETVPVLHTEAEPAQRYLKRRDIRLRVVVDMEAAVRFHPELEYRDEDGTCIGHYPCIVVAITDQQGRLVTLHRIYVTREGSKADVPVQKKMMPVPNGKTVRGACIKLGTPKDGVLDWSEGVETALAVRSGMGRVVWSGISATLLECVDVPEGTRRSCIWADADPVARNGMGRGEEAAHRLAARLRAKGVQVQIFLPPVPLAPGEKADWNDVWSRLRFDGFPSRLMLSALG